VFGFNVRAQRVAEAEDRGRQTVLWTSGATAGPAAGAAERARCTGFVASYSEEANLWKRKKAAASRDERRATVFLTDTDWLR
jgi:hypothetical protein